MAYENFKATVWSKFIQTELEKKCKLVEDCWTQFDGEAKHGAKVVIPGLSTPSIFQYNPDVPHTNLGTASSSSVTLEIDQAYAFNFMVDDIDKAQSGGADIMKALIKSATARLARVKDKYVADLVKMHLYRTNSLAIATPEEAKKAVDDALLVLREKGVDIDDEVSITLSPFFYHYFKNAITEIKSNNDELIKKGIVGMYDNCKVKVSNNLYNDGTDDYMLIRTKRAIAFANGIEKTEAYRPENYFADAVKGLSVFGAKIINPEEIYVIRAHRA